MVIFHFYFQSQWNKLSLYHHKILRKSLITFLWPSSEMARLQRSRKKKSQQKQKQAEGNGRNKKNNRKTRTTQTDCIINIQGVSINSRPLWTYAELLNCCNKSKVKTQKWRIFSYSIKCTCSDNYQQFTCFGPAEPRVTMVK